MPETEFHCLPVSADVHAMREALHPQPWSFIRFPFDTPSSTRGNLRGDPLYRAILRNPAAAFRTLVGMAEEEAAAAFRLDMLVLKLRWDELPPMRECAFSKYCRKRAGFIIAAGRPRGENWSGLRFSQRPWLVCHRAACHKRAAIYEKYAAGSWTALHVSTETLVTYVAQEFEISEVSDRLRTDPAFRTRLYGDQERYGDQLVRLYSVDGAATPYGTTPKDLGRARRFFELTQPPAEE